MVFPLFQLKWFIEKRPSFDKEYSEYLATNLNWFSKMRGVRDDTLHRHYWAYAEMKKIGEIKINRMRGNKPEEEVKSLVETIGEYYVYFINFSKFYEDHFESKLKAENYPYRKLNARMVSDFSVSINHFIDHAKKDKK